PPGPAPQVLGGHVLEGLLAGRGQVLQGRALAAGRVVHRPLADGQDRLALDRLVADDEGDDAVVLTALGRDDVARRVEGLAEGPARDEGDDRRAVVGGGHDDGATVTADAEGVGVDRLPLVQPVRPVPLVVKEGLRVMNDPHGFTSSLLDSLTAYNVLS